MREWPSSEKHPTERNLDSEDRSWGNPDNCSTKSWDESGKTARHCGSPTPYYVIRRKTVLRRHWKLIAAFLVCLLNLLVGVGLFLLERLHSTP